MNEQTNIRTYIPQCRCRLRRFDLEKAGFQQIHRRASESHILHQGTPAQHVHEAFERKLSLPIIPDIAKLRNNPGPNNSPPSTSGSSFKQPMPKRLRTILEDSIGVRSPLQPRMSSRNGITSNGSSTSTPNNENNNSASKSNGPDEDNEYLIANIGIYLVSAKLSIMVCHYEVSSTGGRLSLQKHSSARYSPTSTAAPPLSSSSTPAPAQCDCASSALAMADAKRIQYLLSHIHKLDTIDSARGGISDGATSYGSGAQRFISRMAYSTSSPGGRTASSGSSNIGSIASRHAQIYSADSQKLLCAFPEEGYQKVYGKAPQDAIRDGATLRSLLGPCLDKKSESHAMNLLQCPNVPNSDPIRLELQVRSNTYEPPADVQSIFFRWGHLLFVCQQVRGDNYVDSSHASMAVVKTEDGNILSGYNICTPPNDSPARGGGGSSSSNGMVHDSTGIRASEPGQFQYTTAGPGVRNPLRQQVHHQHIHIHQNGPRHPGETRVFSLPRAPASVVASLPPHPPVLLTPPDSTPPRRQSSYTLPPAKSFEERRFSYPIQILNGEKRPPALPISSHQQLTPISSASINSAPVGGIATRVSPLATMTASPSSVRVSDVRMRSAASAGARTPGVS
ncbi:hypothetical protein EV175_003026, partial [Coemansia sp. RSA 1933]